jgi:hypothetical protein
LWSSTAEIRGKVILNDHYEGLKALFVDALGVQTLTLQMVHDELLRATPQKTMAELKTTVWSFNALLRTERNSLSSELLMQAKVFPVRHPNGSIELSPATIDFVIGDREYLIARFESKIKILDYTVEEVRQLKPFFEWTNLTTRYMSTAVIERTTLAPGVLHNIEMPKRDLKRKAYALLR